MSGLGPQGFRVLRGEMAMGLRVPDPYSNLKITGLDAIEADFYSADKTDDPAIPTCPLRGDVSDDWYQANRHWVVIYVAQRPNEKYVPGWGMRGQQYQDHEWCPLRGPLKKVTR